VDDSFKLLEEKIRKAADRMRELGAENQSLKAQLVKAQGGLHEGARKLEAADKRREAAEKQREAAERAREAAEKQAREAGSGPAPEDVEQLESFSREVKQLRREREEIRIRLGKMVDALEGLE
jgi:chromosome segregation ATPase